MTTGGRGDAQEAGASVHCGRESRSARHRARRSALLAALFAFGLVSGSASAAPGDTLGVYHGSANTEGVKAFETSLGRTVARAHDYLDKRSWATMNDLAWMMQRWRDAGFANRMVLTVPMIPDTGGTLAQGAAGEYNVRFRTLAEQLVAGGQASAVLRLGPEFNGFWFQWTIDVPNGGALYAAYWRQIVATMRAVPGASFTFDWCANAGSSWIGDGRQLEAADAWPGDDVVDYVGMDVYDQSWAPQRADPVARWNEYVNQKNGMAWHAAFAAAHGKPMTFPEWGLVDRIDGYGGGDNPYFIEQMYRWIAQYPVAYHLYFESRDPNAEYAVFSGRFPNAAVRFVEYFGPNPPPPPPPPPASPAPLPRPAAPPPPGGDAPPGGGWPPGTSPGGGADAHPGGTSLPIGRRGSLQGGALAARSLGRSDPAKLSIARARIMRREEQLDILAPITRLASGVADVVLHSAGRRTRFTAAVDSARGQVRIRKRISPAQASAGTGIVALTYAGDSDTQPQEVRLRAAARKANLALGRPRLVDGRLLAEGTISRRARGLVRTQLMYSLDGVSRTREYGAPIRNGRWKLDVALAQPVLSEISQRRGTLQSNTLFTGYLPARIGGEMRSFQVLGE